jgi:hypothetical protein
MEKSKVLSIIADYNDLLFTVHELLYFLQEQDSFYSHLDGIDRIEFDDELIEVSLVDYFLGNCGAIAKTIPLNWLFISKDELITIIEREKLDRELEARIAKKKELDNKERAEKALLQQLKDKYESNN